MPTLPSLPHSASLYRLPSRWQHHPQGQQWGHCREPGATPGDPQSRRPPFESRVRVQHTLYHQFTSLLSSSCAASKCLAGKTSFFHLFIHPSFHPSVSTPGITGMYKTLQRPTLEIFTACCSASCGAETIEGSPKYLNLSEFLDNY